MTWTKLSDDFADDCWTLSDEAFRLHVEGLLWSNRKLVDLHLSKTDVRRFAKHPNSAAELLATGWWEDNGDTYTIRHHAAYQRTREAVVKQQEANVSNGKKGGRPAGKPREIVQSHQTHWVSEVVATPETPVSNDPELDASTEHEETHSLSESLSESPTEMVRTGLGLDRDGFLASELIADQKDHDWLDGK